MEILIIKVGAMGDVLRTTSILPGLSGRHPGARVTWVVGHASYDLVRFHPLVGRSVPVDPDAESELEAVAGELSARAWDRIVSLDDEPALCDLATRLTGPATELSGAYRDEAGWTRMSVLNTASSGRFSTDRTMLEYNEDIWRLDPLNPEAGPSEA